VTDRQDDIYQDYLSTATTQDLTDAIESSKEKHLKQLTRDLREALKRPTAVAAQSLGLSVLDILNRHFLTLAERQADHEED
jgi:hypothetical protein